jgi:hypothetical protein
MHHSQFINHVIHILGIAKYNIENIDNSTFYDIQCGIVSMSYHSKHQLFYHHWHIIQKLELTEFFMDDCITYIRMRTVPGFNDKFDFAILEHVNKLVLQHLNQL